MNHKPQSRDRAKLAIHAAYMAQLSAAWRRLNRATNDPERAQRARFAQIMSGLRAQPYGQHHHLERAHSPEQLQRLAPIIRYDDLEPWITRQYHGELEVLSAHGLTMFERSSGSSAANKLIPYNSALLAEFGQATEAWLFDLYIHRPNLLGTRSYWSISPATKQRERSPGGSPIGVEDDTEYFNPLIRWALKQLMVGSGALAKEPDLERWRDHTLIALLEAHDLGFISIWNPSFLTLLMEHAQTHIERLSDALSAPRAAQVRRTLDAYGAFVPESIWPELQLISAWSDASARHFIPALRAFFPNVELQPKGLLATEGVITIPWTRAKANLLAIHSHFYEFIDLDAPHDAPKLAWQLKPGAQYSPLLTTSAGLLRYELRDVVRCVGHHQKTPTLRFEGKLDRSSDMCGEKLNARLVEQGVEGCVREVGVRYQFLLLAPTLEPSPHYTLYIESDASEAQLDLLAARLERHLERSHHYAHCIELGQLKPLTVTRVIHGAKTYMEVLARHGLRAGDIKPSQLDHRQIWHGQFQTAKG